MAIGIDNESLEQRKLCLRHREVVFDSRGCMGTLSVPQRERDVSCSWSGGGGGGEAGEGKRCGAGRPTTERKVLTQDAVHKRSEPSPSLSLFSDGVGEEATRAFVFREVFAKTMSLTGNVP